MGQGGMRGGGWELKGEKKKKLHMKEAGGF